MFGKLAKSTIIASAIGLPVLALAVPSVSASKDSFYVYNNSSQNIHYLYISEASLSDWQNDILGDQVLYPGEGFQVYFGNPNPSACLYDFRAELSTGQIVENYQIDVCNNDYYEVFDQ